VSYPHPIAPARRRPELAAGLPRKLQKNTKKFTVARPPAISKKLKKGISLNPYYLDGGGKHFVNLIFASL